MTMRFEVNGKAVEVEVEPRLTLADCLRHTLRLTGTHLGCEHGVCGACTVIVNGAAVRSCLMLAVQAEGSKVTTVEGLSSDDDADAAAEVVPQASRAAVRLLHARHAHDRACAVERGAGLRCRARARGAVGESVPLHRLYLHHRGGARCALRLQARRRAHEDNSFIGSPVERLEDFRFLRGRGQYVDDLVRAGHAACRDPAQLGGAWPHPRHRHRAGAARCPACIAVLTASGHRQPVPRVPMRLQPLPDFVPFGQPVIAEARCAMSARRSPWCSPTRCTGRGCAAH